MTFLLSVILSLGAVVAGAGPAGAVTSSGKPSMVRAAFYFGDAGPINFWSSDLSGAPAAFQQIKADGFSAVELVVPWGEFQEQVAPATYNSAAFTSLGTLVALAKSLQLQVILRLSYGVDVDPYDRSPNRSEAIFTDQTVYHSWLDYISRVHQAVARYHDVKIEQLSWEDFWGPVAEAQSATSVAQRLQLATSTGFRAWLQRNYSLARVSTLYGTTFSGWSSVPTPSYSTPSFKLMDQYDDWSLVHRFFEPAAARFPGLNLEARVDVDPIYNGAQVVSSYSHAGTFKLPGTSYIGTYFSPYLGDTSSAKVETAPQALNALQTTLSGMSTRAGNRPVFVFEYEIVSNSPEVADDPALPPSQLPAFILQSEPILRMYALGYSLWVYRDYTMNPLFNPSFSLGTNGWTVTGSASPVKASTSTSLSLGTGAAVSQTFSPGLLAGSAGTPLTVSVDASALSGAPTTLKVTVGNGPGESIVLRGGTQTYQVTVPASSIASGAPPLTISTTGPASISNVQVYNFTQLGDVYSVTGAPEVAAAPLRTVNQQLAAPAS